MKTMISFQCDTLDEARAVIDAVAAIGKSPHACSKQYVEPEEIVGGKPATEDTQTRKNVSPGPASIVKIGEKTKDYLLGELKTSPRTLEYADFHKYKEHLKLLWARQQVKFDGEEYYV